MEYKLINPSDPYTFIAEDLEVAALTVFSLTTLFGAKPKDSGAEEVPVFMFGGAEDWYTEHFGRAVKEGMQAKRAAVADALASMMFGDFEDRRRYDCALKAITEPEARERFIREWQDGHSSMNDIGSAAHRNAKILREQTAKK